MGYISRNWCGLDIFGETFERVNWEYGPEGMYFHSNCKMKFFNKRSLEQAKKRKEKEQAQRKKEKKQTKMIVKIENEAGLKP